MRRRTRSPAAIPADRAGLRRIYRRQFGELAPLRRHICSLLPLNGLESVFEPGCGTGLLGRELMTLTSARYTGMDIDPEILPGEDGFTAGDAVKNPLPADMYVASFFFSSVAEPLPWLKAVRRALPPGGLFALFGEYDYQCIGEEPDGGVADSLRVALSQEGLSTTHGGMLDDFFGSAGFGKLRGGDVRSEPAPPDREFLAMHLDELPDPLPMMTWRVVWGIWRSCSR